MGWGARRSIPKPLRRPFYSAFARFVGADPSEADRDLAEYPSFGEFFARRLRDGARDFSLGPDEIASPCDGRLAVTGAVDDGSMVQAKGRTYHLDELLAEPGATARFAGGWYGTIYLSPADYHRVHSPVSGEIVAYDYVPGLLWPVSSRFVRNIDGLFSRNERAIVHLETAQGPVAVVLVGTIGVGNLWLSHCPSPDGATGSDSRGWRAGGEHRRIELARPIKVARGDELGAFLLGSTVVMAFPRGAEPPTGIEPGAVVRCGQPLGRLRRGTGAR